jgi:antirestriction protein
MNIYVASLSDYNAGILHGSWFNLDDFTSAEDLLAAIQERVLITSPSCPPSSDYPAEEWEIHDIEDAYSGWERMSLEQLISLNSAINEHGEAFRVWVEEMDGDPEDVSAFEDAYEGEYDSELDYIYKYVDDTGMLDGVPDNIRNYFDYEAFARDVFMTDLSFCSGYVFRNY